MKTFLTVVTVVLVLVVVGFLVLASTLGSVIKTGINKYGPEITQSKVQLADAHLSLFSGQGSLNDLIIGNPPGWESDHAFALHQISFSVEPRSLLGDHIVVNSILIDQPDIVYETKITSSNLQDLQKNIQKAAGERGADASKAESASAKMTKKIEIKSFRLQNAKVTVVGAGTAASLVLPTVDLENLGTAEGGLTPEQLSLAVIKEITTQAIQVAAGEVAKKGLLNKAGASLQQLFGGKK